MAKVRLKKLFITKPNKVIASCSIIRNKCFTKNKLAWLKDIVSTHFIKGRFVVEFFDSKQNRWVLTSRIKKI